MRLHWCIPNVLIVLCIVCDLDGIWMVRSLSFVQGSREWLWEKYFSFTTGMEFPNGMKISFFLGKVVSMYLLPDRNYVFKS